MPGGRRARRRSSGPRRPEACPAGPGRRPRPRASRPGGDGEAHRLQRSAEVAVELAEVGDPRVGREVRLQANHPVRACSPPPRSGRARSGASASGAYGSAICGASPCAAGPAAGPAEVVAGQRQGGLAGDRASTFAGSLPSAAAKERVGARVIAGIARLASALVVGVTEQRVAAGVARVRADGGLELLDLALRVEAGGLAREARATSAEPDDVGPEERLTSQDAEQGAEDEGRSRPFERPERAQRRDRPRHGSPRR